MCHLSYISLNCIEVWLRARGWSCLSLHRMIQSSKWCLLSNTVMPLRGILLSLLHECKWAQGQLSFKAKEIECASCDAENCWQGDHLLCVMMLYRLECVSSWADREDSWPSPPPHIRNILYRLAWPGLLLLYRPASHHPPVQKLKIGPADRGRRTRDL